ncbi:FdhF/YdeP family oxidoreductase [Altericroceibacterium endophyticum]|uniref:FdhF/YdeP family oxidoreductase n=1 Tax=Altericroceibacterium endophyticum TaxID=1808508 RepID=A0A6I4T7S7_9SPHN|nr:FdhF/YdeP family oxidoreductase [Altericroceibacterium endophyticum]MXO67016.1 FdhF/YdeP family oxidoreductase [Altericroceibacterium endophyticum]
MDDDTKKPNFDFPHSPGPAGGWGSMKGIASIYGETWASRGALDSLRRLNKPKGVMCVSCAWPKPANYSAFEFCENGAKATLWELTKDRCTPEFFAADRHTVTELREWSDHELEKSGRLTHPMKYDAASDRYIPTDWDDAFAEIGATLRDLPRDDVVFYASGHAGLEASYLYALLARAYGNNNLPQSSNMCHETTSVGLTKVIGSPVGTVTFDDLDETDCYFYFGQNPGTNSPRFLHNLKGLKDRGGKIVTFNPVIEQGLVSFVDPQNPMEMMSGKETIISDQYHQVQSGGDVGAILGLCKVVVEADDAAQAAGARRVIDHDFIAQHTTGFDEFIACCRDADWADIEKASGLTEAALREAAQVYIEAEKTIGVYGMGFTQHTHGALNIAMMVNLLLLKGNIGRPGTGCCPVRGHSNVQGQRTVGIAEKAHLVPMDKLKKLFDFDPPTKDGLHVVDAVKGLIDGRVRGFISLGGNLVRAVPDQKRMEKGWASQDIVVMVSTKLNRSHLYPGKSAFILPCLSRTEVDEQASGNQAVTTEDSFSMINGSIGHRTPASEHLKSELAIVTGIAKATLDPNPRLKWDEWTDDYSLVRDLIEATYPDDFHDFNKRMFTAGGFWRGNPARERVWKTDSGKAVITTPPQLTSLGFADKPGRYRLLTMRSNDQFNTTIYGYSDRFRGIEDTRDVVLMNPDDIVEAGLADGDTVRLITDYDGDDVERDLGGLKLVAYKLPRGTIAGYYPECNVLVPITHHDQISKTPASKSIPVRVEAG